MKRRIIALIATTTLVFAMLPGGLAAASASATANLADNVREVFPGVHDFSVRVTNDASSGLGGLVGAGNSIDAIRVIVPAAFGFELDNPGAIDVPGWDVTTRADASSHRITLTNGSLAPGDSLDIDFLVDVLRPANSDRDGTFTVGVSSNGGQTFDEATGNLTSIVRILQILTGTVTSPLLAANGTASAGQLVDYGVTVRNHAAQDIEVETVLDALDGDTVLNRHAGPVTVPANGGEAETTHEVQFAERSSDGDSRFEVTARKINNDGTQSPVGEFLYAVQVPPLLELDEGTLVPRFVALGDTESFEAEFDKENTPALTVESGTLSFGEDELAIDIAGSNSQYGGGSDSGTIRTVAQEIQSPDGDYPVTYTFDLVDGNGFAFVQELTSSDPLITIDGLIPDILNLDIIFPEDADGEQQIRVKGGDEIVITGEIHDRNPDPDRITVRLVIDGQDDIQADDISVSTIDQGLAFEATIQDDFALIERDAEFHVEVEAFDLADHSGDAILDENPYADIPLQIDNFRPRVAERGYLIERDDIGDTTNEDVPVIEFVFDENFEVLGGCNPLNYLVDGELFVRNVYFSDGTECESGEAGPGDNIRILELNNQALNSLLGREKERGWEGNVVYNPSGLLGDLTGQSGLLDTGIGTIDSLRSRTKDAAGWLASEGVQEIIDQILPPLPEILRVNRHTRVNGTGQLRPQEDWETAVFDEDRYWTRFGGEDLVLTIAGTGIRTGDILQVVSRNGQSVERESAPADSNNDELSVVLPLPTVGPGVSDDYTFEIRILSGTNMLGPIKEVDVTLDTVIPDIDSFSVSGDTVNVSFSEVIWSGSNFAINWTAYEQFEGNDHEILVREVSGSGDSRTLEVSRDNVSDVVAVEYSFESGNRYEDRAGNRLPENVFHRQ